MTKKNPPSKSTQKQHSTPTQVEIIAPETVAEKLIGQAEHSGGKITYAEMFYEGITPPSSEIRALHELDPSYAQQVLSISAREQEARIALREKAMQQEFCSGTHGQIAGFIGFLTVIGVSSGLTIWLVKQNAPELAYAIPVALIGVHAFGTIRKLIDGRK